MSEFDISPEECEKEVANVIAKLLERDFIKKQ
jgi:hypothetical protein